MICKSTRVDYANAFSHGFGGGDGFRHTVEKRANSKKR